jgi:DNA-binding winged helix-turn-helix (wHTH) protein
MDEEARQLLRAGLAVRVSPKAFDLLAALIRERPRVLAKEDLHQELWPDTYVSDASLAMVVAELRAALGESARAPQYVRTVHRHGYAFQGEAHALAPTPSAGAVGSITYWLATSSGRVPLLAGENLVGRDPHGRVWLDSPSVSRRHARLLVAGDRVTVEDLNSKNGTQVGERTVTSPAVLADGDEVRFGSVVVTFRALSVDPTRTEKDR